MSEPSLPLQAALVSALRAPGVLPVDVGVYDEAPAAAPYPYVTLGDCQVLPDKAACIDGSEVFLQIDVWSRAVGYVEAKKISRAIVDRLDDQPIVVTGFDVVLFEIQSVNYLRDPDGQTRHAALTFRTLLNPV